MSTELSHPLRTQLGKLNPGAQGVITQVGLPPCSSEFTLRLLEMGFVEEAHVEVVHQAPLSGDPIVVRVRGSLIAVRRSEANSVEVLVYE